MNDNNNENEKLNIIIENIINIKNENMETINKKINIAIQLYMVNNEIRTGYLHTIVNQYDIDNLIKLLVYYPELLFKEFKISKHKQYIIFSKKSYVEFKDIYDRIPLSISRDELGKILGYLCHGLPELKNNKFFNGLIIKFNYNEIKFNISLLGFVSEKKYDIVKFAKPFKEAFDLFFRMFPKYTEYVFEIKEKKHMFYMNIINDINDNKDIEKYKEYIYNILDFNELVKTKSLIEKNFNIILTNEKYKFTIITLLFNHQSILIDPSETSSDNEKNFIFREKEYDLHLYEYLKN